MRDKLSKKMTNFLSSLKGILLLLALTLLDFLLLRRISAYLLQQASSQPILDTRLWYTPAQVHSYLDALGPANLPIYQWLHLLPDFLFPLLYSLTFFYIVRLLGERLGLTAKALKRLSVFVLLAGMFDLLENASIMVLTASFPQQAAWLAQLAPILTLAKWLSILLNMGILFYLLIAVIMKNRQNRRV